MTSTASFKRRALILSRPTALLVFNELMEVETKSSLIGCNEKVEWHTIALAVYGSGTIFSARDLPTFTKNELKAEAID